MKLKLGDFFIILAVVASALLMLCFTFKRENGSGAILCYDGKEQAYFDLSVDTEYTFAAEYTNVITVKDGKLSVTFSDCPDGVCAHSGAISESGQSICCLPNRTVIRVVTKSAETDVIAG